MNICFITSIFSKDGKKMPDVPNKFKTNPKYDYYCFTNLEPDKFNTSWKVIKINTKDFKTTTAQSRYPKFMAWSFLKDFIEKDYDVIFYCDGYCSPRIDVNWDAISFMIKNSELGFLQSRHFSDNCPYNELSRVFEAKRDTRENIDKTIEYFKKNKLPKECGLYENQVFGYSPKNNKCIKLLKTFWEFYSKEELTIRDQPLWSYILYSLKLKPHIFEDACKVDFPMKTLFPHTGHYGFNNHTIC